MLVERIDELIDAFTFEGGGFDNRDAPGIFAAIGIETQQHCQFGYGLVGARLVHLADDKDIGNLQDTCYDGLDIVTHPWGYDNEHGLRGSHDLDFSLTCANGFDNDGII